MVHSVDLSRDCLDDAGDVVRSCPIDLSLRRNGSFRLELWSKSVDEAICRDDLLTTRSYKERIQLRFQADGCDDLVVTDTWPTPAEFLIMTCNARE